MVMGCLVSKTTLYQMFYRLYTDNIASSGNIRSRPVDSSADVIKLLLNTLCQQIILNWIIKKNSISAK